MFGQPVDPALPLTRLQAWLILVDGFLGRDTAVLAHHGVYGALANGTLGVARSYLPPLRSQIAGMSDEEWAYLVARLSTLAYAIPFHAQVPDSVQEGEAGLGTPAIIIGGVEPPPPVRFPATGRVLLAPNPSPAGISIEWNSADEATLTAHGSLSGDLGTPILTDASGKVSITYTPNAEESQGQGELVTEVGSLFGEATASDLISHAYLIDSAGSTAAIVASAVTGQLSPSTAALARYFRRLGYRVRFDPSPVFPIRWHAANTYRLNIRNKFDVKIQETGGGGPELMRVHRTGRNEAQGVLYKAPDGTYRGALIAWVFGDMDGAFFMGECHDHTDALQWLYVVGHAVAGESRLPPFVNAGGTYAMADLMLYFYPASPPAGTLGPCQGTMDFLNGGPDGRPNGKFLPFNDSRWTAAINTVNWQDGIGLNVFLPNSGVLDYTDNRQIQPQVDVYSQWNVVVTKP
jgi:hypothetical protein